MDANSQERAAQAQKLAAREVIGASPDERVVVRVNGGGTVTGLRLEGALQRYDHAALSELITRTIRQTQLRARAEHRRAAENLFGGGGR